MIMIRLRRAGCKKSPFYGIVVMNKKTKRDGKYIEKIGFFNPMSKNINHRLNMNLDRILYWKNVGAQLSNRVKSLIKEFKNRCE